MPEMTQAEAEKLLNTLGQDYYTALEDFNNHKKLIFDKTNQCYDTLRSTYNQLKNTTRSPESDVADIKYIKLEVELTELKKESYAKLDDVYTKLVKLRSTETEYYVGIIKMQQKDLAEAKSKSKGQSTPRIDEDNV